MKSIDALFNWGGSAFDAELPAFTPPSQPAKTWKDQCTGLTMSLSASTPYYDTKISKDTTKSDGFNWQGTRVDIYSVSLGKAGPYANMMPTQLLRGYDNMAGTAPNIVPTATETYTSKVEYDKSTGKYVQKDTKESTVETPYAARLMFGAPSQSIITQPDIYKTGSRDSYTGAMINTGGTK